MAISWSLTIDHKMEKLVLPVEPHKNLGEA